ncbi:MAG: hypothetical protein PHP08_00300 [Candidatus Dojkabacteria bacterium]|nr:hypothetical protein [Candidatus Dojkabacteria bacterium]
MAGIGCGTQTGTASCGRTILDYANPCESSGTLTTWCVDSPVASSVKLKVFRYVTNPDGTATIKFIGESALQNVSAGTTSNLPCNIQVQQGDWIGTYCASGQPGITSTYPTQSGRTYTGGGDIKSDTPSGSWSFDKSVPSISSTPKQAPPVIVSSIYGTTASLPPKVSYYAFPIEVDPQGSYINDVRLNLSWNATVFTVDSIEMGELFKMPENTRGGITVGSIDNLQGTISNLRITTAPSTVSTFDSYASNPPSTNKKGVIAYVHISTKEKGNTTISLINVKVSYANVQNGTSPECQQNTCECYYNSIGGCPYVLVLHSISTTIKNGKVEIVCPKLDTSMSI